MNHWIIYSTDSFKNTDSFRNCRFKKTNIESFRNESPQLWVPRCCNASSAALLGKEKQKLKNRDGNCQCCSNFSYSIAIHFSFIEHHKNGKINQPFKCKQSAQMYVQNHFFYSQLSPAFSLCSQRGHHMTSDRFLSCCLHCFFLSFSLISALCLEAISTHLCIHPYGNIESSFCWMFSKLTWTDMNQRCVTFTRRPRDSLFSPALTLGLL